MLTKTSGLVCLAAPVRAGLPLRPPPPPLAFLPGFLGGLGRFRPREEVVMKADKNMRCYSPTVICIPLGDPQRPEECVYGGIRRSELEESQRQTGFDWNNDRFEAQHKEGSPGKKELRNPLAVSAVGHAKEGAGVVSGGYPRPVRFLRFTDEDIEAAGVTSLWVGGRSINRASRTPPPAAGSAGCLFCQLAGFLVSTSQERRPQLKPSSFSVSQVSPN